MSASDFSALGLSPALRASVAHLGYQALTPIQAKSLPLILAGRDLIAQAKTGSGKTAAFSLGLLSRVDIERLRPQALILCPTRELATQVAKEVRELARFMPKLKVLTLGGGSPVGAQASSLRQGAHILVGTPGRIEDLLQRGFLDTRHLGMLVLDEADRMLDMGFGEAILGIVEALPKRRQTLLFSATFPNKIAEISRFLLNNPESVRFEEGHCADKIEEHFLKVRHEGDRRLLLQGLLERTSPESAIVFCRTREECDEVAYDLSEAGFTSRPMHGGLEQRERDDVLVLFAHKSIAILVATDVASRGLDVKDVQMVVNYSLPRNPEVYIHRIGRTGRAGAKGRAYTMAASRDQRSLDAIAALQKRSPVFCELNAVEALEKPAVAQAMVTLKIAGGRKNRLCRGDILGALTAKGSDIEGRQIGKIDVFDWHACVAVEPHVAKTALALLEGGRIKGRTFKACRLE